VTESKSENSPFHLDPQIFVVEETNEVSLPTQVPTEDTEQLSLPSDKCLSH